MTIRHASLHLTVLGLGALIAFTEVQAATTVMITGSTDVEDTSLYDNTPDGNAGADPDFFVGRNGLSQNRRALLRFDLSSIPSGSTVSAVTLDLVIDRVAAAAGGIQSLHRVTGPAPWVEGTGTGTGLGGGQGGTLVAGAACWNAPQQGGTPWATAGGDFVAAPSASTDVGFGTGVQSWSGPGMVADVQAWVDGAATNDGWILIGDETTDRSARSYVSSEGASNRPVLSVTYTSGASTVGSFIVYR
jgi:hypothetical protein